MKQKQEYKDKKDKMKERNLQLEKLYQNTMKIRDRKNQEDNNRLIKLKQKLNNEE